MAGLSQVPVQQAFVDQHNAHEGRDPNRFRGRVEVEAARQRKYFHKEFGWAMTKDEAEAWAGFKTKVAETASKYKKEYVDPAYKARERDREGTPGEITRPTAGATGPRRHPMRKDRCRPGYLTGRM